MRDSTIRRYTPASVSATRVGANTSGLIAAIAAPLYLYFAAGTELWISLAAAPFGFALAWALFGLRQWLGGVSAIVISEEGFLLEQRKRATLFRWPTITGVRFSAVNTTPWLTVRTESRPIMVCLETFSISDVEALILDIANHLKDAVTIEYETSWTLLNRTVIRK